MSLTIRLLNYLSRRSQVTLWLITAACLGALGSVDYLTGTSISITFFYLFPIAIAAWSLGPTAGWLVAALSALVIQVARTLAGDTTSAPILLWNSAVRLAIFLVIANLISEFRRLLMHQTELSRTDPLTEVLNLRAFHEAAAAELKELQQVHKPLTFTFLDIDDFKAMNDTLGHAAGDRLLMAVGACLRSQLWGTDIVARLGGDEFGILMPHTDSVAAQKVIPRLRRTLLDEMAQHSWPVTFSIGAVTCTAAPANVEQLVQLGDQRMYDAKRGGKDQVRYSVYGDEEFATERQEETADAQVPAPQ